MKNKNTFYKTGQLSGVLFVLFKNYHLSTIDTMMFCAILWKYDASTEHLPVYMSYEDFSTLLNCDKMTVYNSIKVLIKDKLILKVGERKGRAKTGYIPNAEFIDHLFNDFIALNTNLFKL